MGTEDIVIVVTGSRHWTNEAQIKHRMQSLVDLAHSQGKNLLVVHGGAKGVDRMCAHWAEVFGARAIAVKPDYARWGRYGAPLKRNILMLEQYNPNWLEAFRAAGKSNGTDHCMKEARARDIPVNEIKELDR